MSQPVPPTDIAREALRRLVAMRLPPTPENYTRVYYRVAEEWDSPLGVSSSGDRLPDGIIRENFAVLLEEQARKLESSVSNGALVALLFSMSAALKRPHWVDFRKVLEGFIKRQPPPEDRPKNFDWPKLVGRLIEVYLFPHQSMTPAIKHEQLEETLAVRDIAAVYRRLDRLVRDWEEEARQIDAGVFEPSHDSTGRFSKTISGKLRILFVDMLTAVAAGYGRHAPEIIERADYLAHLITTADSLEAFEVIERDLRDFCFKAELHASGQLEIQEGLIRLLETMLGGIAELLSDDERLKARLLEAQLALRDPIRFNELEMADRILTAIIIRQVEGKAALDRARGDLKNLLFKFIGYLSDATDSTEQYHEKMDRWATRLAETNNMTDLSTILSEILSETNQAHADIARASDRLNMARRAVQQTEARIEALEDDVARASELALTDPTTGILNRRGIDERLNKEIIRARRRDKPLSIAMLDVDNFRQLVDRFGYRVGDEALNTLIDAIVEQLRKGDLLARYSGEAFLLLYPETLLADAKAMTSTLQRALTKRFFLSREEHVLITFSAGVAELIDGETDQELVQRATAAMFLAKKQGKNRVVGTDDLPEPPSMQTLLAAPMENAAKITDESTEGESISLV